MVNVENNTTKMYGLLIIFSLFSIFC